MGQAAGFQFSYGSHSHFVPLLSMLVAPKDDAVLQYRTTLLQGTRLCTSPLQSSMAAGLLSAVCMKGGY